MERWARRRRYRIVTFGHVIACAKSRKLLFIDFVMEKESDPKKLMLACVYYSHCRGGNSLQMARDYMHKVQLVCNEQMEFYPQVSSADSRVLIGTVCAHLNDARAAGFGTLRLRRELFFPSSLFIFPLTQRMRQAEAREIRGQQQGRGC